MRLFTGFPFASLISSLYEMTFLILQTFSTQFLPFLMIIFSCSFLFQIHHLYPSNYPSWVYAESSCWNRNIQLLLCIYLISLAFLRAPHCPHIYSKSIYPQIYSNSLLEDSFLKSMVNDREDSFLRSIVNQRSLSRFSFLFLEIVAAFMFLLFLLHFLFCASLCKANIQLPSSYTVFWDLQLVSPSHAAPVI